jgi:aspartate aminotransferase-like enzyme
MLEKGQDKKMNADSKILSGLNLVPGPTLVPEKIREIYSRQWPSPDLDPDFAQTYKRAASALGQLLGLKPNSCLTPEDPGQVVIMSGEGMVALWAAVKSMIRPGDRVLAIDNGIFGRGIGEMAASCGAEVEFLSADYSQAPDLPRLSELVESFQPTMVTAVHCETPTGLLNPLGEIAVALRANGWKGIFCVDAVASIGATPVKVEEWEIDICLGGSQKVLSCPPDTSFLYVSQRAWKAAQRCGYQGYDALLPFHKAALTGYFPYTHNWAGVEALATAAETILAQGIEHSYERHAECSRITVEIALELGLDLYPEEALSSPTVTALRVPEDADWDTLNRILIQRGVHFGGSYGHLAGKVFRIGHMGSQADVRLVKKAMDELGEALLDLSDCAGEEP